MKNLSSRNLAMNFILTLPCKTAWNFYVIYLNSCVVIPSTEHHTNKLVERQKMSCLQNKWCKKCYFPDLLMKKQIFIIQIGLIFFQNVLHVDQYALETTFETVFPLNAIQAILKYTFWMDESLFVFAGLKVFVWESVLSW